MGNAPLPELGSRADIEAEIDEMLRWVRSLRHREPDDAMRVIAAIHARASELEVHLHRYEQRYDGDPYEYKQIRTMQVIPLKEALDHHYRYQSRLIEIRRQDQELNRG